MRAAIYARYSDPRQNPASIRDQIAVCRDLADREGHTVVQVFTDAAISGAATANRPGFLDLMRAARAGGFDLVITEALDRLSRSQADTAGAFEDLYAQGVRILTVSEGMVDELHVGLKGTMNALFLRELGAKTSRGMRGVIEEGRVLSTPYGYRVVRKLNDAGELVVGLREIDPVQGAVVRRIYRDYADGISPHRIAFALNAEGVPTARGGAWTGARLAAAQRGILSNPIYRGQVIWGVTAMVKDRATGRRRERRGPGVGDNAVQAQHEALRIIDEDLWNRVQRRRQAVLDAKAAGGGRPEAARRPKRLLSGVMTCGVCGAAMNLSSGNVKGDLREARFRCRGRATKGPSFCSNGGTVPLLVAEQRVLQAVRDRLLRPEAVDAVVREVHRLSAERSRTAGADRARIERDLTETRRKAERLVDQVAEGALSGQTVMGKIRELESRALSLEHELAGLADAGNVVAIHPAAADHYRRLVDQLGEQLSGDTAAEVAAREAFRRLIGQVRMIPSGRRGVYELEIVGRLQDVIGFIAGRPGLADAEPAGEYRILA